MAEESLQNTIVQQLEHGAVELPLKPEIVTRVLAMSRNPVVLRAAVKVAEREGASLSHDDVLVLLEGWEAPAGRRPGDAWDLPQPVREAILHYRDFTNATDYRSLVAVTQLASMMAARVRDEQVLTEGLKEHLAVWELQISAEQMEELLERAGKSLATVAAIAA